MKSMASSSRLLAISLLLLLLSLACHIAHGRDIEYVKIREKIDRVGSLQDGGVGE